MMLNKNVNWRSTIHYHKSQKHIKQYHIYVCTHTHYIVYTQTDICRKSVKIFMGMINPKFEIIASSGEEEKETQLGRDMLGDSPVSNIFLRFWKKNGKTLRYYIAKWWLYECLLYCSLYCSVCLKCFHKK